MIARIENGLLWFLNCFQSWIWGWNQKSPTDLSRKWWVKIFAGQRAYTMAQLPHNDEGEGTLGWQIVYHMPVVQQQFRLDWLLILQFCSFLIFGFNNSSCALTTFWGHLNTSSLLKNNSVGSGAEGNCKPHNRSKSSSQL